MTTTAPEITAPAGRELLTHSRMRTARDCLRKHFLRYELGLVADRQESKALRIGSAVHKGLELWSDGIEPAEAIEEALEPYIIEPDGVDSYWWAIERETVRLLLEGYAWRYQADPLEYEAVEFGFDLPLVNPSTGRTSRTFRLGGKVDGIVRLADGRLAVLERKTVGESIDAESDYWLRLRVDQQISLYMLAAREKGYPVETILYDALRKPTLQPRQVPILDDNGEKIVLDADGQRVLKRDGKPRQTGDTAKGYELQSRMESPSEYRERVLEDIGERPDYYFQRREIPRLDADLDDFRRELWQTATILRRCENDRLWPMTVSRNTCPFCDFKDLCLERVEVDPASPPAGFVIREHCHPELEELRSEADDSLDQ